MFQRIVRNDDFALYQNRIEKYFGSEQCITNLDIIKSLYKALQANYRCEYVYKNNLVIKLIKEHNLRNTIILNEFKIGASKADLVMLNGSIRVFEIKTELDSFSKLSKQLGDYQKIADEVSIITDEKSANKVEKEFAKTNFGIIILDNKNKLRTIKEPIYNNLYFNFDAIFKILRKQEYLNLVKKNFGSLPDVPNTKIFRTCYGLLEQLDLLDFQKQVLEILKERKLRNPEFLKSSDTPKELKHICNSLDFNEKEYIKLYNFLSTKRTCINHI